MRAANRAFVVHCTPTRIRLKIPERARQHCYFHAIRRALLAHPDVRRVQVTPLVASVVIECEDSIAFLEQNQRFPGLELLPVQASRAPYVAGRPTGAHLPPIAPLDLAGMLMKILLALATNQLGAQITDWVVGAVVRAAREEARRIAVPAPPKPRPMLLVALAH